MKSYNEMAQDVLRRMDEYETAKKKRNTRLAKGAASLCCCALVLLLGLGVQHSGLMEPEIPATVDDALYPGIPDLIDDRAEPTVTEPAPVHPTQSWDSIIINELSQAPDMGSMNIALMVADFIGMDEAELNAYYGTHVFPAVPDDLKAREDRIYGIYCRNGGTGELYWDQNILDFSNTDLTRWVCISIDKGSLPYTFVAFQDDDPQKSVINGAEVVIGQWDADCYYAEFMLQDVGFRVCAEGLTLDELIAVISSLIA